MDKIIYYDRDGNYFDKLCKVADIKEFDEGYYMVLFLVNDLYDAKRLSFYKDGIEFDNGTRFEIGIDGKLDIIGVKKYLHNREISEVLENI